VLKGFIVCRLLGFDIPCAPDHQRARPHTETQPFKRLQTNEAAQKTIHHKRFDELKEPVPLLFVDGKRGDDVLIPDSKVIDLGGPGVKTGLSGGDGSGGCFVNSLLF